MHCLRASFVVLVNILSLYWENITNCYFIYRIDNGNMQFKNATRLGTEVLREDTCI